MVLDRDRALAQALVEEACRKSALVWVSREPGEPAIAAWHVWVDGAVVLVTGGIEQTLPGLPDDTEVRVTARSKETGARILTFLATVSTVCPDDDDWETVTTALHAKRLNAPDGEGQPARWARESRVVRLAPTGHLVEAPGRLSARSHAAEPPDSPATTRGPVPFTVGRRPRRRR